jgi:hypothetical protein
MADYNIGEERKGKGGRSGKLEQGREHGEFRRAHSGVSATTSTDSESNIVARSRGRPIIEIIRENLHNIITRGEFPGYEKEAGSDDFVKKLIQEAKIIGLIPSEIDKDLKKPNYASIGSQERIDAFKNVTQKFANRLSFLAGVRYYLTFILNRDKPREAPEFTLPKINTRLIGNENFDKRTEMLRLQAQTAEKTKVKERKPVTAEEEARDRLIGHKGSVAAASISAPAAAPAPAPVVPTSSVREYFGKKERGGRGNSGNEKYFSDTEEYYMNKYLKYKTKYLDLKNLLN